MLLKIYIGSIIFHLIATTVIMFEANTKLSRLGLKGKISDGFSFKWFLRVIIVGSIPVFNVFIGLYMIFSDTVIDKSISRTIKSSEEEKK